MPDTSADFASLAVGIERISGQVQTVEALLTERLRTTIETQAALNAELTAIASRVEEVDAWRTRVTSRAVGIAIGAGVSSGTVVAMLTQALSVTP
jgi:hypothetical protein